MGFLNEFRDFVNKGNVIQLAIAVIIGAAFGTIVSSLVDDVITPLLLNPALKAAHVDNLNQLMWGVVKYGNFLAAVIKFLIVALVLFFIVKGMTSVIKKKEATPAGPTTSEKLLMEIRDELKRR